MHNIKLTIEYDGTRFYGWQTQKTRLQTTDSRLQTIQQVLEKALRKILKEKIKLIGSGRTDSGVHAIGQVANFKTKSSIKPERLKFALNGNLPKDIRILKSEYATLNFHSQYWAKSKVYRYFIQNQETLDPFFKKYSYWYKIPLDTGLMKRAARFLIGRHDFKSFCASGSERESSIRTIKRISISRKALLSCRVICIEIEADGFLYNMVRNIVGTLVEVGRERLALAKMEDIILSQKRSSAGPCLPAHGLFLVKVKY